MAMRQICHAGQMLLGLTDILARKEGAFGQASLPDLTAITLLIKAIALTVNIFFFFWWGWFCFYRFFFGRPART